MTLAIRFGLACGLGNCILASTVTALAAVIAMILGIFKQEVVTDSGCPRPWKAMNRLMHWRHLMASIAQDGPSSAELL